MGKIQIFDSGEQWGRITFVKARKSIKSYKCNLKMQAYQTSIPTVIKSDFGSKSTNSQSALFCDIARKFSHAKHSRQKLKWICEWTRASCESVCISVCVKEPASEWCMCEDEKWRKLRRLMQACFLIYLFLLLHLLSVLPKLFHLFDNTIVIVCPLVLLKSGCGSLTPGPAMRH